MKELRSLVVAGVGIQQQQLQSLEEQLQSFLTFKDQVGYIARSLDSIRVEEDFSFSRFASYLSFTISLIIFWIGTSRRLLSN